MISICRINIIIKVKEEGNKMSKNPAVKNILSALAVTFFGFILLILAFISAWLMNMVNLLFPGDFNNASIWFLHIRHIVFAVIIALISWSVFKSKLKDIYKAIYLPVPAATAFVILGILLYRYPAVLYSITGILFLAVMAYFFKTKKNWLYYYAFILTSAVMLVMNITGAEI
jgi:hypothetical protein